MTTTGGGTAWISSDGSFIYQSAPGSSGTDSFVCTLVDGGYATDTATVTPDVAPAAGAHDRPVAAGDAFEAVEDTVLAGNLLDDHANGADADPDGDTLSLRAETILSDAGGVVRPFADGSFTYTPRAGFSGADGFSCTLRDPGGASDAGRVTLAVTPVNDAPVAGDDTFSGVHDRNITGNLLARAMPRRGPCLARKRPLFGGPTSGQGARPCASTMTATATSI